MSEEDEKRRESAGKTIMIGIGFAVVGLLLSAASYGGASSGYGHYYVFYGLVIWGIWDVLKGLFNYFK